MRVIDRELEVELLEAALRSGAHVVLEGPPGTGKSTLLRQVSSTRHVPFVLVEGNAELTPARLVGHFDPALVLSKGYQPDVFVDGPLIEAMRSGGLLYVEELNRVPEETLNVLLTVMSEGEICRPAAGPGAGGARLPAGRGDEPVRRRRHRADLLGPLRPDVPDRDGLPVRERRAADRRHPQPRPRPRVARPDGPTWCGETREHPDIRVGSSVRGAIDGIGLAVELAGLRGVPVTDWKVGLVRGQGRADRADPPARVQQPHARGGRDASCTRRSSGPTPT